MTTDGSFDDVLSANDAYASAFTRKGLSGRAARGLAVLTCMDSRIEPLAMLGLEPGDAKILRNAGARVTDEILATLVVARYLLDVERVMVIAHTDCRMAGTTEDGLRAAIRAAGGPPTKDLSFRTTADSRDALREDVGLVRSFAPLSGLDAGGFLYDVDSGRLTRVC